MPASNAARRSRNRGVAGCDQNLNLEPRTLNFGDRLYICSSAARGQTVETVSAPRAPLDTGLKPRC